MWYGLCVRRRIGGDFDVQYVKNSTEYLVEDDLARLAANIIDITGEHVDVFTMEIDSDEFFRNEIYKINHLHEKPEWLMEHYR